MARRWSKKETNQLLQGVGVYGISWFMRHTRPAYSWRGAPSGRTKKALYAKAYRLYGRGGFSRGSYSLSQVCAQTGYSKTQIRRAAAALQQKWKRTSAKGKYLIFEEQMEELADWLRFDYWAKKGRLYCCAWCGSEKRAHYAVGLCARCYQRYVGRMRRAGLSRASADLLASLAELRDTGLIPEGEVARAERALQRGHAPEERFLAMWTKLRRTHANRDIGGRGAVGVARAECGESTGCVQ